MPRVKEATRERILGAAIEEFAGRGLAGGRMERIATKAEVNIKSVYLAYGGKQELFDAAVCEVLGRIGAEVPFTPDDLPGWAGRFFDAITAGDAAHRLNLWRMLEAPAAGPDDRTVWASALSALRARRGTGSAVASEDVLLMVPAMAAAWLTSSADLAAAAGIDDAEARRQQFRASLVTAVRLLDAA